MNDTSREDTKKHKIQEFKEKENTAIVRLDTLFRLLWLIRLNIQRCDHHWYINIIIIIISFFIKKNN